VCVAAFHDTMKHSAETTCVIGRAHHHDRTQLVPVAPIRKRLTLILASAYLSRDLLNVPYAKGEKLSDFSSGIAQ
jgi:hypothetical protein